MMGRGIDPVPRTTLNVTRLAKDYGIQVAMGVNNVQNAFTPQGSVDPLSLCPLGAAVFQSATQVDCEVLLVCFEWFLQWYFIAVSSLVNVLFHRSPSLQQLGKR